MPVFQLTDDPAFPPPNFATEDGLLAVGGDLTVERLVRAYSQGIFPWYGEDDPILWWSPNPRMVVFPEEFTVSRSLRRRARSGQFRLSSDTAFEDVIAAYVERSDSLRASIRSALIYPGILVGATVVSLLVFLAYVVPQFEVLFGASAADLPAITRGVFAVAIIVRAVFVRPNPRRHELPYLRNLPLAHHVLALVAVRRRGSFPAGGGADHAVAGVPGHRR